MLITILDVVVGIADSYVFSPVLSVSYQLPDKVSRKVIYENLRGPLPNTQSTPQSRQVHQKMKAERIILSMKPAR